MEMDLKSKENQIRHMCLLNNYYALLCISSFAKNYNLISTSLEEVLDSNWLST